MKAPQKNKIAIILTLIAIVVILVYGIDAILDIRVEEGFLPFDSKIRGYVLGLPSVILPFVAFGIMWKLPSRALSALLLINGIIIFIGSVVSVSLQETSRLIENSVLLENFASSLPMIFLGLLIMSLGIWSFCVT